MIPRTNRILIQNRPQFADADMLDHFLFNQIVLQLGQTEPTERQLEFVGQFTGDGFDGGDLRRGKKSVVAPSAGDRPNENRERSNLCAI